MTIVRQIQLIFDAELQSKKIEMVIHQDESFRALGIEWVRADPSRISQILINLLSNSIKFLDQRPIRRITLTLGASTTRPKIDAISFSNGRVEQSSSNDLYLSFSIKDTGPGLKEAEMSALFQRFMQATPRTHVTYGGSGLGLFISKRLVELQGGRIYANSQEGQGSTFAFYIKVERSTKVGSQVTSPTLSPRREGGHDNNGNQIHVLVVEDNLINQRLLKKQLVGSGYRVSVANHGQEAFDKVLALQDDPKEKIHVVLMDVEMPILDVAPLTNRTNSRACKQPVCSAKPKQTAASENISQSSPYKPHSPHSTLPR
jgi:CheY-like chemotaxis protein